MFVELYVWAYAGLTKNIIIESQPLDLDNSDDLDKGVTLALGQVIERVVVEGASPMYHLLIVDAVQNDLAKGQEIRVFVDETRETDPREWGILPELLEDGEDDPIQRGAS